jgi:putative FmdB family regulatory protein
MPIYEYGCSACGHTTDILHGYDDAGPQFCPSCGADGTMRKGFAPPAIVFKGSGWAKKDRNSGTRTKAAAREDGGADKTPSGPTATGSSSTSSSGASPGAGGAD